jgi:hypothetical protein
MLNISTVFYCRHVLHKYANEDVSLGAWFLGLDVEHIDDRRLCCGTPPGNSFFVLFCFQISLSSLCVFRQAIKKESQILCNT